MQDSPVSTSLGVASLRGAYSRNDADIDSKQWQKIQVCIRILLCSFHFLLLFCKSFLALGMLFFPGSTAWFWIPCLAQDWCLVPDALQSEHWQ